MFVGVPVFLQIHKCWQTLREVLHVGNDAVPEAFRYRMKSLLLLYLQYIEYMCIRTYSYSDLNSTLSTNCATIHGIEYRAGCCLYIGETELYPCFGTLKEILVIQDEKFFVIQPRTTLCYSKKLLAYNVGPDLGPEFITTFLELKYKFVLSKKLKNGQLYVQFTKWGDVELDL